jgi:trehalose synthase
MSPFLEVATPTLSPERFASVLRPDQYQQFARTVEEARRRFAEITIWNLNSTAVGGGVAEMLHSLIGYIRGAGIDARWLVVPGGPEFFRVTKRIHNHLHGAPGDGGALDEDARRIYEEALHPSTRGLAGCVRRGDVVILHDPQTAGLVPAARSLGAVVVWRCHVGMDTPNDLARAAWRFLLPYVREAHACVFSRRSFAWEGLAPECVWVIPPSIDAFSAKNVVLDPPTVRAVLAAAGVLASDADAAPTFPRADGSRGTVRHRAEMIEIAPAASDDRLVVQVSRWDRLKDPMGVIEGFADHVAAETDAHLVVAGPAVEAVADDPEGAEVLVECTSSWSRLPEGVRPRVHLACLPMDDAEENAAIVNALQRRAEVVVQKSLAEGFGLTVAEAMWKGRPVVASRIGGIQDQIRHGETGLLLDDPCDLAAFGGLLRRLLDDPAGAAAMGRRAQEAVRDHFLGPRHLMQYAELLTTLLDA